MKINNKAESLAGIVIGVFILTIVVVSIGAVIGQSRDLAKQSTNNILIDQLKNNSDIILDKLDYSGISDGENFFIYKDIGNKKYEIKVGNSNSNYKYIDSYGNNIGNIDIYKGDIFIREFTIKNVNILGENKNIYIPNITNYIR